MSSALLLVDEMGYDPMNREDASLFFRFVSYRYGRGAMVKMLDQKSPKVLAQNSPPFGLGDQPCI
jgi:DNA replication protein DnaC